MKRFHVMIAIVAVAGLTSTALAQRQGGRGFGGGGVVSLLSIEEVQKELNITSEQNEKLQALRPNRADFQNLRGEELQKKVQELAKKADETIKTVLDEKQQTRLEELRIQREGASSLERAEVVAKLGLDAAQKEKIKKIQADNASARGFDFQNATQEERQKYLTEARERREKMDTDLLAVLTADQKAAFEKMKGEKFEFPQRGRTRNQNN